MRGAQVEAAEEGGAQGGALAALQEGERRVEDTAALWARRAEAALVELEKDGEGGGGGGGASSRAAQQATGVHACAGDSGSGAFGRHPVHVTDSSEAAGTGPTGVEAAAAEAAAAAVAAAAAALGLSEQELAAARAQPRVPLLASTADLWKVSQLQEEGKLTALRERLRVWPQGRAA